MDYRPGCNGNNLMREKAVVMTRLPKARVIVFKKKNAGWCRPKECEAERLGCSRGSARLRASVCSVGRAVPRG